MKKYKLVIKIIIHIIIIYSFFNLYSLRYFFKKIKLPLQEGQIYKSHTGIDNSFTMTSKTILDSDINFIENTTKYVFKPKENDYTYYIQENNKSIIEWNETLKRWIKIGKLDEIKDKSDFMNTIIDNINKKYENIDFEGLNLGCVFGNDRNNIHSCKIWKKNFGIGENPYVAVTTEDKINKNALINDFRNDPKINKTIPFIYIFFAIIIAFVVIITIK